MEPQTLFLFNKYVHLNLCGFYFNGNQQVTLTFKSNYLWSASIFENKSALWAAEQSKGFSAVANVAHNVWFTAYENTLPLSSMSTEDKKKELTIVSKWH